MPCSAAYSSFSIAQAKGAVARKLRPNDRSTSCHSLAIRHARPPGTTGQDAEWMGHCADAARECSGMEALRAAAQEIARQQLCTRWRGPLFLCDSSAAHVLGLPSPQQQSAETSPPLLLEEVTFSASAPGDLPLQVCAPAKERLREPYGFTGASSTCLLSFFESLRV